MKTVYFIRHGESLSNVKKTFTGQQNAKLSKTGLKQAELIKNFFENISVDEIYSSTLIRTVQTATPLSKLKKLKIKRRKCFKEIGAGKWEGKTFDYIAEKYPSEYSVWRTDLINAKPTKGESVRTLCERVYRGAVKILEKTKSQTVVISTHATPVRAIKCYSENGNFENIQNTAWAENASVSKFTYENGKFTFIKTYTEHLDGLITELPKNI